MRLLLERRAEKTSTDKTFTANNPIDQEEKLGTAVQPRRPWLLTRAKHRKQ